MNQRRNNTFKFTNSGECKVTITVNGVGITEAVIEQEILRHARAPEPQHAAVEALVIRELLRQEARARLAEATSVKERAVNAAANDVEAFIEETLIERLIDREVEKPALAEGECQAYYEAHPGQFRQDDLVEASHILFEAKPGAVTSGLRQQAEEILQQALRDPGQFETLARTHSACTSAAVGGSLGQLSRGDTVPEFERVIFSLESGAIATQLVESRFGLHIVKVAHRAEGRLMPYEMVSEKLAAHLLEQKGRRALRRYLQGLVARAEIHGIVLGGN
jgi:peptidyl-prolyl cis-trans isomerase C